jgi:hypothetical protein
MEIKMSQKIYRGVINQPSTLQPLHDMHGKYCIVVDDDSSSKVVRLYFIEGVVHSMMAPRLCVDKIKLSSAED